MLLTAVDLAYIAALALVALYGTTREPLRLTATSMMLASFWVLYGIGHFIYYDKADAVDLIRERVTQSLILMWFAMILGIELARTLFAGATNAASAVGRSWERAPLRSAPGPNQVLAFLGIALGLFYLGAFVALGKPGQILQFLSLDTASARLNYRITVSGQGGYLYQFTSMAIGPFLAVLLLLRARAQRDRLLMVGAMVLTLGLLLAKVGTLQKVPWLILLLQLLIALAMVRNLNLSLGRILGYAFLLLGGSYLAALVSLPQYDTAGLFEFLFYRIFEINNDVVYQTFYVYPDYIPHQWGMNIGLLHRLFGDGELVSAHSHVADFFSAFGATFDAFFIGDAWVDFGYWGVGGVAFAVGFIVKALDVHVLALGKSPLAIALLTNGFYGVFQLQVTSAFTALLSGGLLFVPLVVLIAMRVWENWLLARSQAPVPPSGLAPRSAGG